MTAEQGPGGDLTEAEAERVQYIRDRWDLTHGFPGLAPDATERRDYEDVEFLLSLAHRIPPAGLAAHRADPAVDAEAIAADGGHWAAHENNGPTDLVCNCGLPWTPTEGCAYMQGATATLYAAAGVGAAEDDN